MTKKKKTVDKVRETAKGSVTIVKKVGKEKVKETNESFSLLTNDDLVNPARVTLARSETFNLGNFESRKIEISLSVPCECSDGGVMQAWDTAVKWVEERMEELTEELDK